MSPHRGHGEVKKKRNRVSLAFGIAAPNSRLLA